MSASNQTIVRRCRPWAVGALIAGTALAGCDNKNQVISIDIPRMSPNPATIGTKTQISVIVFNKIGCNLASIKVTYGVSLVSTKSVDIGQAYLDSVVVTGTGPVKAEATCGDAINTQAAILTAN